MNVVQGLSSSPCCSHLSISVHNLSTLTVLLLFLCVEFLLRRNFYLLRRNSTQTGSYSVCAVAMTCIMAHYCHLRAHFAYTSELKLPLWYKMTAYFLFVGCCFPSCLSLSSPPRSRNVFLCVHELIRCTWFDLGGSCRGPYLELPPGEIPSCAPESWREELPHFLPAARRGGRGLTAKAGPREEPTTVSLLSKGVC